MKFPKITYNSPVTLTFALLALGATLLIQFIGQSAAVRFFSVYRAPLTDPLFLSANVHPCAGPFGYVPLYGQFHRNTAGRTYAGRKIRRKAPADNDNLHSVHYGTYQRYLLPRDGSSGGKRNCVYDDTSQFLCQQRQRRDTSHTYLRGCALSGYGSTERSVCSR